jgi:hypothetical protein
MGWRIIALRTWSGTYQQTIINPHGLFTLKHRSPEKDYPVVIAIDFYTCHGISSSLLSSLPDFLELCCLF